MQRRSSVRTKVQPQVDLTCKFGLNKHIYDLLIWTWLLDHVDFVSLKFAHLLGVNINHKLDNQLISEQMWQTTIPLTHQRFHALWSALNRFSAVECKPNMVVNVVQCASTSIHICMLIERFSYDLIQFGLGCVNESWWKRFSSKQARGYPAFCYPICTSRWRIFEGISYRSEANWNDKTAVCQRRKYQTESRRFGCHAHWLALSKTIFVVSRVLVL